MATARRFSKFVKPAQGGIQESFFLRCETTLRRLSPKVEFHDIFALDVKARFTVPYRAHGPSVEIHREGRRALQESGKCAALPVNVCGRYRPIAA